MATASWAFVPSFLKSWGGQRALSLLFLFAVLRNWALIKAHVNPSAVIAVLKAAVALLALIQGLRYINGLQEKSSVPEKFLAKPLIFPCRTSHTRLFPKTHSFSYSYLWVGVPIGWKGSVGGMLSSDEFRENDSWYWRLLSPKSTGAWQTVNSDDYLGRGHVDGGLEEKLHNYLISKNLDPKDYPFSYLLTAPKFLGYASNPVSIWNLYSASKELKAFILEVNNTFDERHIYFVEPEVVSSASLDLKIPPKLISTWPKDFYVSTFNSRAGNYWLSATDPLFPYLKGSGVVDTTVTLKSPYVSLVARVYSSGPAIDPLTMSVWSKTKFLSTWWWVGLATFPRTVVQAVILLTRRKIPWVFRPEPRGDTMSRHADPTEILIETIFRKYLQTLVESTDVPLRIKYSTAGLIRDEEEMIISAAAQLTGNETNFIEIKVLTPSFYSRFIHYSSSCLCSILASEHTSGTILLSSEEALHHAVLSPFTNSTKPPNILQNPQWWAIQKLRVPFKPLESPSLGPACPKTVQQKAQKIEPIMPKQEAALQLSDLETFILTSCTKDVQEDYASRVLKLFISEYIAFGWMELLDLEMFLVKAYLLWTVSGWLVPSGL